MPKVCFVFSRFEIQVMDSLILNWHLNQRKIDDGRLMGTNNGRGIAMNQTKKIFYKRQVPAWVEIFFTENISELFYFYDSVNMETPNYRNFI